jgi:hypothetical protein
MININAAEFEKETATQGGGTQQHKIKRKVKVVPVLN